MTWLSRVLYRTQVGRLICIHTKASMSSKTDKPIILVTGNPKKLEEFIALLGDEFKDKIKSQDIDLPEYQGTPEEVAREKCKLAAESVKGPVITEDTSLCFDALGGMPGPYIKWFLKEIGPQGLYKMLSGFENKSAQALCIMAYYDGKKDSEVKLFCGKTEGRIVDPRGPKDFGWDPCFEPTGFDKTYAEMPKTTKNSISHRGKSVQMLKDYLKKSVLK